MKNLLKILPLILLCWACSSDSDDVVPAPEKTICFGTSVNGTRADVTVSDVKTNGFKVWGGYGTTSLFNGQNIVLGSDNIHDTGIKWTFNTYNFFAVYPNTVNATYTPPATFSIDNYNVQDNPDTDLMVAIANEHIYPDNGEAVGLNFRHTLANVTLELKKSDENAADVITVKQVYLLGVTTKGSYQWKKEGETITAAWTVDYSQTPVNKGSTFNEELTTTYKSFLNDVLVIPQTVDSDNHPVVLIVVYDFTINSSETIKDNILYANLPASPAWEIGKKITYQATINAKKDIVFKTPTVEDWGTQQVGGTIIIK